MPGGRPSRIEVYTRLSTQIDELWQTLGGLPRPFEARDVWEGIWYAEAHHSTAIEGNTLRQSQVEELLRTGQAVGDKQLSEYLEVKGYADAARWVYEQAVSLGTADESITMQDVRETHHRAMAPLWETLPPRGALPGEGPGNFRQSEIARFSSGMKPPINTLVHPLVERWVSEANGLTGNSDTFIEQLATLHARFERIHPFFDGNGRTGRLLLNLQLVRLGYPPAIIYSSGRPVYLRALRAADRGDHGPLGEFLARAVLDNLHKFIVPAVAGPARLVPLAALANEEIKATALRIAAYRGKLDAIKGADGQWRSSRNKVDEYLATRWQ